MIKYSFYKFKYGKELLVDSLDIAELIERSLSLKEFHATSFYEMFFFTSGGGKLIVEGNMYEFQAPAVLLLPPAQPRVWDLEKTVAGKMIIFEGEFMEAFLKDHRFLHRLYYFGNYETPPVLPLNPVNMSHYILFLQQIRDEIAQLRADSHHLLRAYLYQLLIMVNRSCIEHFKLKGDLYRNKELLDFRQLLKKNIREKQTVKEYAELLGIPRNRLNRLCQETYRKNALYIIQSELLLSCKTDLLSTSFTVAEISNNHNFSAPSNFARFFKSLTKISPAGYRSSYSS